MDPSDRSDRDRAPTAPPSHLEVLDLPHGVTAGDVTATTAVVWTRVPASGVVHVEYGTDPTFDDADRAAPYETSDPADTDGTVAIRLTDLEPGSTYWYRVWALAGPGARERFDAPCGAATGRFRTAPEPGTGIADARHAGVEDRGAGDPDASREPVSFVWTGDTYGQGRAPPYQVPRRMAAMDPDFFLYLGDTIYADSPTPAVPDGEPETVEDYRAKYREVREDATNLREFLATTSVYAIWDDHEVLNDWAGTTEPRMPAGRQAFFEYWPIDAHAAVTGEDDHRLYRSFRWGDAVELFVLDGRQYRDDNAVPDGPEKTMLGDDQREWLKRGLAETDAAFAVVASTTSLSSPSSAPDARDSWVNGGSDTGFETELLDLTNHVRESVDSTVVFLTGDRHFARVASFDPDRDGEPEFYEAMASPMGAAPREPGDADPTLGPTVHFEQGGKYEYGEFYDFGYVEATTDELRVSIYDKTGERHCTVTIAADGGWPTVDRPPGTDGTARGPGDGSGDEFGAGRARARDRGPVARLVAAIRRLRTLVRRW